MFLIILSSQLYSAAAAQQQQKQQQKQQFLAHTIVTKGLCLRVDPANEVIYQNVLATSQQNKINSLDIRSERRVHHIHQQLNQPFTLHKLILVHVPLLLKLPCEKELREN